MLKKINILIVEDNVLIADDIQQILEENNYNVIGNVISYEQAIRKLSSSQIDLVFIDIKLSSNKDGIELANYINLYYKIPFIFLTSHIEDDILKRASLTNPYAYLTKPFDKKNIIATINMFVLNSEKQTLKEKRNDYFFFKKSNTYYKVETNTINYIKSDNVYLEIYCSDNSKYLIRSTLKEFLSKLPENFKKCNKSYIVNLNNIEKFEFDSIHVSQHIIPVSKNYKNILKDLL